MGVSSTQVGDHWGSARTVQPITFSGRVMTWASSSVGLSPDGGGGNHRCYYYYHLLPITFSTRSMIH